MRYVMFDDFKPGVLDGERVIDISGLLGVSDLSNSRAVVRAIIARHSELSPKFSELLRAGKGVPLSSVRLRQPVPDPVQLLCAAKNYQDGSEVPEPNFFLKASGTIIGPNDTVVLPEARARVFNAEPELAVVIKSRAANVKAADAMQHVFGYTCFLDVSGRGVASGYYIHKSFHTFGPMGPAIVTADEVGDPQNLRIRFWNGDELRQDFSTSQMANSVAQLIEAASAVCPLLPGDVIPTGTFHIGLRPVQNGETITIDIEKVGRMSVKVEDPLRRTWDPNMGNKPKEKAPTA